MKLKQVNVDLNRFLIIPIEHVYQEFIIILDSEIFLLIY